MPNCAPFSTTPLSLAFDPNLARGAAESSCRRSIARCSRHDELSSSDIRPRVRSRWLLPLAAIETAIRGCGFFCDTATRAISKAAAPCWKRAVRFLRMSARPYATGRNPDAGCEPLLQPAAERTQTLCCATAVAGSLGTLPPSPGVCCVIPGPLQVDVAAVRLAAGSPSRCRQHRAANCRPVPRVHCCQLRFDSDLPFRQQQRLVASDALLDHLVDPVSRYWRSAGAVCSQGHRRDRARMRQGGVGTLESPAVLEKIQDRW